VDPTIVVALIGAAVAAGTFVAGRRVRLAEVGHIEAQTDWADDRARQAVSDAARSLVEPLTLRLTAAEHRLGIAEARAVASDMRAAVAEAEVMRLRGQIEQLEREVADLRATEVTLRAELADLTVTVHDEPKE